MRGWRISAAVVAAFVLTGAPAARACAGAHAQLRDGNATKVRRAVACLVNRERRQAGLPKVRNDRRLAAAARDHSADMVAGGYFAHDGPAGDTVLTRALRFGYLTGEEQAYGLAENLATQTGTAGSAARIVRDWMASPLHRLNVLSVPARDAGVGVAAGTPFGDVRGATFTLDLGYAR